jgi:hypothetical protein
MRLRRRGCEGTMLGSLATNFNLTGRLRRNKTACSSPYPIFFWIPPRGIH